MRLFVPIHPFRWQRRGAATHVQRRAGRRCAFTLIELLVVTAIIGLLLSILLPALKRSLRQARSTVCMGNLRALDQVMQLYRTESRGWLPHVPEDDTGDANGVAKTWYDLLIPRYMVGLSVLICPDDPYGNALEIASRAPVHPDWENASSYGLNGIILLSPGSYLANIERNGPRRPSDTLIAADMGPDQTAFAASQEPGHGVPLRSQGRLPWSDGYDWAQVESSGPWMTQRHGDSINVLTLGGVVRKVRTRDVMRQVPTAYYDGCAAGDCTLCNDLNENHYSFAHAYTYWWTGPIPVR